MNIQKTKCNQCLFTKDKIVSSERKAEVIKNCLKKDIYFNCHKTQLKGIKNNVCCRGFWDAYKNHFTLGRLAQRLKIIKEVIIN